MSDQYPEAKILSVTFEPNCLYYEFHCDSCLSVVKNDDFNYADTEDEALRAYGQTFIHRRRENPYFSLNEKSLPCVGSERSERPNRANLFRVVG